MTTMIIMDTVTIKDKWGSVVGARGKEMQTASKVINDHDNSKNNKVISVSQVRPNEYLVTWEIKEE
jgi:hypothetical protein